MPAADAMLLDEVYAEEDRAQEEVLRTAGYKGAKPRRMMRPKNNAQAVAMLNKVMGT